jgi:NADPH:quinone reductase-like Zn-dependent oxidoreductase
VLRQDRFLNDDDVILDIGGNTSIRQLRKALRPAGTLVITGGEGNGKWFGVARQVRAAALSPFVRQRLTMAVCKEHHDDLEVLTGFFDRGEVVPAVERTYRLDEVPVAMTHLVEGRVRAKVAIEM